MFSVGQLHRVSNLRFVSQRRVEEMGEGSLSSVVVLFCLRSGNMLLLLRNSDHPCHFLGWDELFCHKEE
jgi:hypothetical protein